MIIVLDDDGRDQRAPATRYAGLDRYEARSAILADLEARGDLVGRAAARDGHRPLPALQRRHRAAPQDPVVHPDDAARRGGPRGDPESAGRAILPARFEKVWEHWLTNIRDWNVCRQLWWGHRIPAWYCPDGHVTVSADAGRAGGVRGVRPAGRRARPRTPTSSTPGSARGCGRSRRSAGRTRRPTSRRFYPASVMETGYDIIFFWVARMMMLGHPPDRRGAVPHGLPVGARPRPVRPEDVEDEGQRRRPARDDRRVRAPTPLRFALIHGTTPGNDQRFGPAKLENARNFANKLWNAARFVLGARPATIPADAAAPRPDAGPLGPARALAPVACGGRRSASVDRAMADYAFGEADADPVRRRSGASSATGASSSPRSAWPTRRCRTTDREATWWTLVEALDTYLRLLHPVMPFVTEAALGRAAARGRRSGAADRGALAGGRGARAEAEAEIGGVRRPGPGDPQRPRRGADRAGHVAAGRLAVPPDLGAAFAALRPGDRAARPGAAAGSSADREALGASDGRVAGGRRRRARGARPARRRADGASSAGRRPGPARTELAEAEGYLAAARARLANEAFTAKAPPAVVEGARAREAELADQVERLRARLG